MGETRGYHRIYNSLLHMRAIHELKTRRIKVDDF